MQAEITITRRSRSHMAPEGFFFEVLLAGFDATGPVAGEVYDDRFHEIYYFWNFGDPYTFTAPQNLSVAHKNANVAYGPMASHTYRAAGSYTVSVLVVEPSSGKQTTATLTIAIGDPANLFGGSKTIFVSPSSNWENASAGATLATSFDAAVSTVQGNDTVPRRIMLNRGETHTFAGAGLGDNPGGEWPSCHIVASGGAGTNPAIICSGGFYWNDDQTTGNGEDKDFVLQNIDFTGPYSSVTGTGTAFDMFAIFANSPNLLLFDGCSLVGFDHAIFGSSRDTPAHTSTILNDTLITDFRAWGFADYAKIITAITGSTLRAHVDALVDSTPNMGAPIRSSGGKLIIHSSDFFSRQGWSAHGNYLATQPALRLNAEGDAGAKIVCQANALEGGHEVLQIKLSGVGTANATNAVVEKNYILGGYQTYNIIGLLQGGVTVRNNIMVWPDGGRLATTNDPYSFVYADDSFGNARNRAAPVNIYSNTMVNMLSAGNSAGFAAMETSGGSNFTTFTVANNVIHQPNLSNPDTSDAPLESSPILWPPREKGYRTTTVPLQTQTATPSNIVATYAPLSGSAALGDAINDPVAYDDFYGNPRPQYPSRGALEMP